MMLHFTKMHGLGNDFVLVDCRKADPGGWNELSRKMGDRRLGIGFDQLLLLRDSKVADFKMEIYNSDGSRVEMCGNGIRCFAKYLRDKGIFTEEILKVETMAGIQVCNFDGDMVVVDMGGPILEGRQIPVNADGNVKEYPLPLKEGSINITCVSMGNPHAVIFVDDAESYPVEEVGPVVENHPFFPNRTNVEFAQKLGDGRVRMRVWERGAGVTMACGTGACATAVASFWTGRTEREVEVILDGGSLYIRWDRESNHVFMTGPAATVFECEYPV